MSTKPDRLDVDILAAAVIAAGMYANPKSLDWTAAEIANDAVVTLQQIKDRLTNPVPR
jgi:hypothetical protein